MTTVGYDPDAKTFDLCLESGDSFVVACDIVELSKAFADLEEEKLPGKIIPFQGHEWRFDGQGALWQTPNGSFAMRVDELAEAVKMMISAAAMAEIEFALDDKWLFG
jgi:hypothetical protein